MSSDRQARFAIGQVVEHKLFGYRGAIYNVDASFQLSEEWYEQVARSRPPRDRPWYHVLPDGATHTTYVAERNLDPADEPAPIRHPLLDKVFERFDGTKYHPRQGVH